MAVLILEMCLSVRLALVHILSTLYVRMYLRMDRKVAVSTQKTGLLAPRSSVSVILIKCMYVRTQKQHNWIMWVHYWKYRIMYLFVHMKAIWGGGGNGSGIASAPSFVYCLNIIVG